MLAVVSTVFFDRMIWFIIRYSLLFDTVNGFFLHSGRDLPISQSLKTVLLFFVICRLASSKYLIIVPLVLCYVISLFIHFSFIIPSGLWGESINHVFKFLSVILYFYYIRHQLKYYADQTLTYIKKAIRTNTFILVGNILIGLLGLGYAQYGDTIGFRGYFYAGNEVSGVLLLLFPFTLYQIGSEDGVFTRKYFFYSFLFLITGVLTVTKTAILGTVLTLVCVPFICPDTGIKKKNKWKFLSVPVVFMLIGFIVYYGITQSEILDRWLTFYDQSGVRSLLSGRDNRVEEYMSHYLQSRPIEIFLGLGGCTTVEMDPFDTLFNYGILGVLFVYVFYFYLFLNARFRKKRYLYAPLAFFCNFLILSVSSFAGHILFSGMAGIFIAIVNGLVFYKTKASR